MPLSTRDKKPSFGRVRVHPAGDLSCLLRGDPLSPFFDIRVGDRPADLANLLVAQQKRMYDEIVDLPQPVLIRHMKLLLKEHNPDVIKRAIVYASWTSEYPFTIKYIRECIDVIIRSQQHH